MSANHVSTLDPNHPFVRRVMELVGKIKQSMRPLRADEAREWRLYWAARLIRLCAQHIANARPRVEFDEAAQERISFGGSTIGTLKRPVPSNHLLDILAAAIEHQLCGDDGREGDSDADAETGDEAPPAPASRGTSAIGKAPWVGPLRPGVFVIDNKCAAAGERDGGQ